MKRISKIIAIFMVISILTVGCTLELDQGAPENIVVKKEKVEDTPVDTEQVETGEVEDTQVDTNQENDLDLENNKVIEVDGGDLSGHREPNVKVNIGFGDREYWAYTNEHGQLVKVTAKEIILQDEENEPVKSNGRYYWDEAKVPGTEQKDLDEGHIIADSLGGVANAYNITPQDSTLNRHGDQAYMEKVIRQSGGCSDFEAKITYPDTETQIPDYYYYTYTLRGNEVVEAFPNKNPEDIIKEMKEIDPNAPDYLGKSGENPQIIDKNGDGVITIAEAKAAGYKMPITKDHWLYKYMIDRDGDGVVGE